MSFILEPVALVDRSINKELFSVPMREILHPSSLISIAILKIINAKSMFEIVLVLSDIFLRITKNLLAFPMF